MKRTILPIFLALLALTASAQPPQFTSDDYDSWTYSNPNIPLSPSAIAGGRVVFYVNSLGVALTLTSSQFNCQGINKIDTDVIWYTKYFGQGYTDTRYRGRGGASTGLGHLCADHTRNKHPLLINVFTCAHRAYHR